MDTQTRLPAAEHLSRPWRIREIAQDFRLEDVWALPMDGTAADFGDALKLLGSFDPTATDSVAARVLWGVRDLLGRLGLGRISDTASERPADSLADRLPDDLRGTATGVDFGALPFVPLYRTADEFAAEVANATMHGVLHLAWVDQGDGRHRAQMAVYVKPRGWFGDAYMAAIRPFRHRIVYPALMRQVDRAWRTRPG